jgi:hypothetical protein
MPSKETFLRAIQLAVQVNGHLIPPHGGARASSWPPTRGGHHQGSFGSRGGHSDEVGNLKRGGSLARDKPTSEPGNTLRGDAGHGLRTRAVGSS